MTNYKSFTSVMQYLRESMKPPIPRQLQRMIMISSLAGLLKEKKDPDTEIISKLNTFLSVDYKAAWYIPMQIHSIIWKCSSRTMIDLFDKTVCLQEIRHMDLNQCQNEMFVDWLLRRVPNWLHYGSTQLMKYDIRKIIHEFKQNSLQH